MEYNNELALVLLKRVSFTMICAGAAYSPVATESEDRRGNLCDSGLPDGDVCNVLLTPSVKKDVLDEAWARGYTTQSSSAKCLNAGITCNHFPHVFDMQFYENCIPAGNGS